ncbi:MAG TPA: ribosome biogenesis GTPase Der [Candidatus Fermentibacter daniensis]|nr:ribosome biogenesis GTPase Der [Candidatus Fermentibacter daniensis]HOR06463.1 ribosome biogenesis GTPase Der [Candidatus Fermentibacter daniensis]HOZ18432.1 ribosome biogenesis GTPase Der [Candidatus Fermentibacter daniensis]HPH40255.1 ribosome biogenesis GTPase Der [Candidatus Fermentibacter daniensis]HPK52452.1 ribosome biogenesis GTPase Der [Candidatus Fermentibacter daniensis]
MAAPTVAIIGRVNVGKSTLFNRIVGGSSAIVSDFPGVTRDRNIALASWAGHDFFVVDTGGLVPGSEDPMQSAIERQVGFAIEESDAVILVVDGSSGPHPFDATAADLIRRSGRPVVLAVNKGESQRVMQSAHEFYCLGLGEPIAVSALHGTGSGDLLDALVALLPREEHEEVEAVSLAIVGKPNVGKSSLYNRLAGAERGIVSEVPGTTRDATDTMVHWKDRTFRLVDTAGLRRTARRMEDLEFYSTLRTWKSLDRSDVVLVLMDGNEPPSVQDLRIAGKAWEMGRGLIIGVNKLDLGFDRKVWLDALLDRFHPARWVPVMFFSALTGAGVGRILPMAARVSDDRAMALPTSEINRKLEEAIEAVQPPSPKGKPLRFFYATQITSKPPRLLIFTNRPDEIPEHYRRYIDNAMRELLGLKGVPLRIIYRKREH